MGGRAGEEEEEEEQIMASVSSMSLIICPVVGVEGVTGEER